MSDPISYEDYLEEHGTLTYSNVGASMLPLLRQGKDLFTVERKAPGTRCKVGDVVLFRRPPDKYVLHRVVEVMPDSYTIMGDNCVTKERDVRDEDILGVMTGFVRKGKAHSVDERGYRAYSAVTMAMTPVRVFAKKAINRLRRSLGR
ncbi:MAG: S26 family signal peptidase [Eggerthellaceae bacterium]|nr:S26 family signal peptidase [Eggerthellaceae bacterium]